MQKSRMDWLRMGDKNTKFHTPTMIRRMRNRVDMLKNDESVWVEDGVELKRMALSFYKDLFTSDSSVAREFITSCFLCVDTNTQEEQGKEVIMEETKRVPRDMGSYKALGPDGYQAIFFKKTWHITGEAVHSFVKKAIEDGEISEEAAEASLVLIPKETKPCNICGFRPLILCNAAYKLISKVIVNRLKLLTRELISPSHASFVPGSSRNRQRFDLPGLCPLTMIH